MKLEEKIAGFVQDKIVEGDVFIVAIRILPKARVVILMDGDKGISIEKCSEISRYVGFKLEEENLIEHAYTLEVSSPGVDYPLVFPRQYTKHIGRSLAIKLAQDEKKEGKLVSVTEKNITIEELIKEKGKKAIAQPCELAFSDIKEAKVLVSFK